MTRVNTRLFRHAFGNIQEDLGVHMPSPLRRAMDKVNSQIDQLLENAQLAEKKMQRIQPRKGSPAQMKRTSALLSELCAKP